MNEQIIEKLKQLASRQTDRERIENDFKEDIEEGMFFADYFDGDADDAYMTGEFDGKIELAREILDELGITY